MLGSTRHARKPLPHQPTAAAVWLEHLGFSGGGGKLLGLWRSENEGAKCWCTVLNELTNLGGEDYLIACVDGLKGMPEAIEAVFPQTQVQLYIVHKVRNSLKYVPWKERQAVATNLYTIYAAVPLPAAEQALKRFAERWDSKQSMVKLLYLALQNVAKQQPRPILDWKAAFNQFVILFGERVPDLARMTRKAKVISKSADTIQAS